MEVNECSWPCLFERKGSHPPSSPFLGANLIALGNKNGGIRPIVVRCAKIAGKNMSANILAPCQLGFGIKARAEAAVHAAMLVLKLDFDNAFNSIRHYKMLLAKKKLVPEL